MTDEMRTFESGATRDQDTTKIDFEGFLSPFALLRFGEYMHKHRHTPAGLRDSDNWQKGIPLVAYIKSLMRHVFQAWSIHRSAPGPYGAEEDIEEALCAIIFNAQGYLHEIVKKRLAHSGQRYVQIMDEKHERMIRDAELSREEK